MEKTNRQKSWFDDEVIWRELYPYMFYKERFERAATEMAKVLKLTKARGKSVLDLGCGPGRCSLALARRGYRVTGVDKTPFLLNKAKQQARREKLAIEWRLADMREYVEPNKFNLAISMYTTFGYFDDPEDDLKVLRNIFASLKPGGKLLMEMMGKEIICRNYRPVMADDYPDGTTLIQRNHPYDSWRRNRCEWLVIKDDRVRRYAFNLRLFSGGELSDLLEKAGFQDVNLYGSFEGIEYGLNAQRLIAAAVKPV